MLQLFFYQLRRLLERIAPNIHTHFSELNVDMSFFSAQWFLTLFVYHFQFRAVLRVWDIFFTEGWKIIFRVGVALLKWEEKRLLTLPFDELMPAIKALHEGKDCEGIITRSLNIKFKTEDLMKFRREYELLQSQK